MNAGFAGRPPIDRPLTDDDVREVAAAAGLRLAEAEIPLFREAVTDQLARLGEFVRAELDELPPGVRFPDRDGGHRPAPGEDPFNAWIWRCSIGGASEGLLAGKTVGLKDHIPVAGIPLTYGSRALEHLVPDFDATVVTRVLDAGGRVVGKNVLNGFFGPGGTTGGGDFGRPLNPHSAGHVTGGSSSGSAAAVAARDCDIAFGGDQGGSIRIPAAWCGVVGLKPTFGLVSSFGVSFGYDQSLDHVGPIGRHAVDVAAALQAVAGHDGLDPRQSPETPASLDVLTQLRDGVDGIRIGVLTEGFEHTDPEVGAVVMSAVEALATAGATVAEVSVPEHLTVGEAANALVPEGARALFQTGLFGVHSRTYYPGALQAELDALWRSEASPLNPRTALACLVAEFSRRTHHGRVYAKAQNVRRAYVRAYDEALVRSDVLLMPTADTTAPRYPGGRTREAALRESLAPLAGASVARNTQPFNYTGHPALAVPCGRSNGLPVSMQLVGRRYDDPLLLRVAHAFEQAVPYDELIAVARPTKA